MDNLNKMTEAFKKEHKRSYDGGSAQLVVFMAGWNARPVDPWDMVPEEPVNGESERNLIVATNGMWAIISSVGTRRKVITTIASGYNCDVSRNRETRVCRDGKWIDE